MSEILIATLAKNSREQVRVTLSQWGGRELVDIRAFYPVDGADCFAPSKKGLACQASMLGDIIAALQEAKSQAEALGWIEGRPSPGA